MKGKVIFVSFPMRQLHFSDTTEHRSSLPLTQASLSWGLRGANYTDSMKDLRFPRNSPAHSAALRDTTLLSGCSAVRSLEKTMLRSHGRLESGEERSYQTVYPHPLPKHLDMDTECLGSSEHSWSWKPPASHFLN